MVALALSRFFNIVKLELMSCPCPYLFVAFVPIFCTFLEVLTFQPFPTHLHDWIPGFCLCGKLNQHPRSVANTESPQLRWRDNSPPPRGGSIENKVVPGCVRVCQESQRGAFK